MKKKIEEQYNYYDAGGSTWTFPVLSLIELAICFDLNPCCVCGKTNHLNTFWNIRYLALKFGSQVIGMILPYGSYASTNMFNSRYFYNRWTWMFFRNWCFRDDRGLIEVISWFEDGVFKVCSKTLWLWFSIFKWCTLMILINKTQDFSLFSW